jgi:hypothetical protein
MECCISADLTMKIQGLINDTGVLQDLSAKCLDLNLLMWVFIFVHRAQEGLSVELDASLHWRVDRAVDGCTQLFYATLSVLCFVTCQIGTHSGDRREEA